MSDDDHTFIRKPGVVVELGAVKPCLIVLSGSSAGLVRRLDGPSLVIGRSPECDVTLHDNDVSKRHAKVIQYPNGVVVVKDLRSTNGTFVNGRQESLKVLQDGDRIQLGSITILKFSVQDELEGQLQQRLYESAVRDGLTNLYNRRFFEEDLSRALSHAARHEEPLALLLLDLDHFKTINDTLGHSAGDVVLKEVSRRLSCTVRNEDVLCRVGGEEFAVIARSTSASLAVTLADRLRARIAAAPITYEQQIVHVTTSIGIAEYEPGVHTTADFLIRAADRALYQAKGGGRNRACVA